MFIRRGPVTLNPEKPFVRKNPYAAVPRKEREQQIGSAMRAALQGTPLIFKAIRSGNLEWIKENIKEIDINAPNVSGEIPLLVATEWGKIEIVAFLLEQKEVTPKVVDRFNKNALHYAIDNENLDLVELLYKTMGEPELLSYAVRKNKVAVIKFLIEKMQVDPALKDKEGKTALHYATINQNIEIIDYLVKEAKINSNLTDDDNRTALHYAVINQNIRIIKYLVNELKINIHIRDFEQKTLLHYAAINKNIEIIDYLVNDLKIDLNLQDVYNRTAIHYVARSKDYKLYQAMIRLGADPKAEDCDGLLPYDYLAEKPPFIRALCQNKLEEAQALYKEDPTLVTKPDEYGRTALFYVAKSSDIAMARWLFTLPGIAVSDVVVTEGAMAGSTALHIAAKYGNIDVATYLFFLKADMYSVNTRGLDAWFYARKTGREMVVLFVACKNHAERVAQDEGKEEDGSALWDMRDLYYYY